MVGLEIHVREDINTSACDSSDIEVFAKCYPGATLYCDDNQLKELKITGYIWSLSCTNNNIESLDFSNSKINNITIMGETLPRFRISGNPIKWISIKNGFIDIINWRQIINKPYLCCDESELHEYEWWPGVVNTYCSFKPGGKTFLVNGDVKYDLNNDGCLSAQNISVPNLKFKLSDTLNLSRTIISNQNKYNFFLNEGKYLISPQLVDTSLFIISPSQFLVEFPGQKDTFSQMVCIKPKIIQSNVDLSIFPISATRPGFNTTFKLVLCPEKDLN